jgi:copper resistance protein D
LNAAFDQRDDESTMTLYHLNVTIHLLAAFLWLGGMFFFAVVGAPVLRGVDPALRADLFRLLGERFRSVGWIAIGVLMVTGVANLHFRGLLRWELWSDSAFWSTALGTALMWKLITVALMVGISAAHDFVIGPAASRLSPGSPEARATRSRAAWLARVNAVVGLLLVLAAVRLTRGG